MRSTLYNSYAEIHLKHLGTNLKVLKERSKNPARVLAVIKADAYGHGSVKVAEYLSDKVDWLGVANVREGIELRNAGIAVPILVLGVPDITNAQAYKKFGLTAVISAFEHFDILPAETPYHLNFDTGMGRLGFYEYQLPLVLDKVETAGHLKLEGVMSHFSTADQKQSAKAEEQKATFNRIHQAFPDGILRHLANTGGAVFYDNTRYDMVRFGIGLFGYPPGPEPIAGLKPVLKWKSHLAQVKPIKKGWTVSYLDTWAAPYKGYLGIIPVGYGDGYPRNIGGKIQVYINGKFYRQVGIVTMDYMMVFLDQNRLPVNSEVVLMGVEGLTATEMAHAMETINYEILCRLTERVERVYIK